MKSDSGSRSSFSRIFDFGSGSERKKQDPAGSDSRFVAPDIWSKMQIVSANVDTY